MDFISTLHFFSEWTSDQLNISSTFLSSLLGGCNSKPTQKWRKKCSRNVPLIRDSFGKEILLLKNHTLATFLYFDSKTQKRSIKTLPKIMVFCTKIVLTYCEKKLFSDREKLFEITSTINSNSERSDNFLATECYFNLFLEVSHI